MAGTGQRKAQREAEHREVDGRHHRFAGQIHRHLLAHSQHSRSLSRSSQEVLDIQLRLENHKLLHWGPGIRTITVTGTPNIIDYPY